VQKGGGGKKHSRQWLKKKKKKKKKEKKRQLNTKEHSVQLFSRRWDNAPNLILS